MFYLNQKSALQARLSDKPIRIDHGFTLVELVVVITVLGVLASIAIPSFSSTLASFRAKSIASNLYTGLVKARSEAIKRNAKVSVLPVEGGWQAGWIIAPTDKQDMVIDQHNVQGSASISGPANVDYNSSGRPSATATFDILVTVSGYESKRCVAVGLSGIPSIKADAC